MDAQLSEFYDKLLKEKNSRLRDKNAEINFLRNALWDATHGDCDHPDLQGFEADPIPTREEEPLGINGTEELCLKILTD